MCNILFTTFLRFDKLTHMICDNCKMTMRYLILVLNEIRNVLKQTFD